MQIIFLLIFSSMVFGQKNLPGTQCDPVEAEKECYNLLCKNTPKRVIPSDPDELAAAYRAHPYELSDNISQNLNKLITTSDRIKETGRKALENNELDLMAAELITTPVETASLINELYKGDLHCLQVNRKCNVILSDLNPVSDEMQKFFSKLNESSYLYREGAVMEMDERKAYLNDMMSSMNGKISQDVINAEKRKIKKMKRDVDFMIYLMDAPWIADYKKKMEDDLKPYQASLAASLKVKIAELIKIDLSSKEAKQKVKNSCQLASFIKSSLEKSVTPEKFEEKKRQIIDSFKTKFLPKLSASSAEELSAILKPEGIFLIPEQSSFEPFPPALGKHSNGYQAPTTKYQVLQDLSLIPRGHEFRCQSKGMLIKDYFNFGNDSINISQYALANNFDDAITHELGHWLSAQMKKKKMSGHSRRKLLDVRECIAENYPKDKSRSTFALKHRGDKSKTEEDFADWFTAKAGLGESGLFCDLKKMVNSFVGISTESSYLPHKADSHSNFLFREMALRLNRNEVLPQSCKDLADYYPESKPQKCDW